MRFKPNREFGTSVARAAVLLVVLVVVHVGWPLITGG